MHAVERSRREAIHQLGIVLYAVNIPFCWCDLNRASSEHEFRRYERPELLAR